jgi:hypothetical protein
MALNRLRHEEQRPEGSAGKNRSGQRGRLMSSRERILALSVGSTVALLVAFWCWSTISGMYKFRATEIEKVEQSLAFLNIAEQGSCTAFVINEKENYVLTANHCFGTDVEGKDILVDNTPAKLVAKDAKHDLMVLYVKGLDKPALHMAKSDPRVGDEIASYGFGLGLDRVLLALEERGGGVEVEARPLAVIVGADPAATAERLRVATELRAAGLSVRAELAGRKLGRQLEGASREGAHFAVILGDELADGQVQLRDLEAGTQHVVPIADLVRELRRAEASHHHG